MCNSPAFLARLRKAAARARIREDASPSLARVTVCLSTDVPSSGVERFREVMKRLGWMPEQESPSPTRAPRFALGDGLAQDENRISLFLTQRQKDDLLRLRGETSFDLSKIIRACIAISLPALREHPQLISIMNKKRR